MNDVTSLFDVWFALQPSTRIIFICPPSPASCMQSIKPIYSAIDVALASTVRRGSEELGRVSQIEKAVMRPPPVPRASQLRI